MSMRVYNLEAELNALSYHLNWKLAIYNFWKAFTGLYIVTHTCTYYVTLQCSEIVVVSLTRMIQT